MFYLFIQRIFDRTSSRDLISRLLGLGYDSWEQISTLNEQKIVQLDLSEFVEPLLETISEVAGMEKEIQDDSRKQLTVAILMKGVNKKKDYSK